LFSLTPGPSPWGERGGRTDRLVSLRERGGRAEHDGGDFFEEGGHEDAGAFLGLFAAAAVAFAEVDEGLLGLGDLEEGFEELGLALRVAAVFECVEVAFGGAGAGAGAAPVPPRRWFSH
jgi:hypothetical protein